ncbi:hypothetical protein JCM17961_31950 [Endothiovibrio diazotrophicus]
MHQKFGKIFEALTGRDPASCKDLLEVERVAEQALHHSLPIQPYDANIVEEDGNVFEVADYIADLDRDIDRKLAKMRVACRP